MKLTAEVIQELMDYDPETGVFTWRSRDWWWFPTERSWKWWNTMFAGKPAGCLDTDARGYPRLQITLLGKNYLASRLAFLAVGESLPERVGHANRDSLDDRWSNLAPGTHAEDGKNRSMNRRNSSGVCGVSWHRAAGKWRAKVQVGGKYHYLGLFDDLEEAAAVVAEFRAANGFSDGHGQLPGRVR